MKGKLIVVWNPILNGIGSTTIATSIATLLSWFAFKKVHLTNFSHDNDMEKYISDDVEIKYTLDNLKVLKDKLNKKEIKMYSTSINDKLNIIGGYTLDKKLVDGIQNFSTKYLDAALEIHDYVVVDLSNNKKHKLLKKADILISILPFNKIYLNQLSENKKESKYILKKNSLSIFNNVSSELQKEVLQIANEYNISTFKFLQTDPNIHYFTCIQNKLYSYLIKNINSKDNYIDELMEIVTWILEQNDELYEFNTKKSFFSKFKNIS